ncbi:hypothetical protein KDW41_29290 [Burkholderia vietnamiensis]|nr:hypothetical protein [Burkholderia vietnamiensis]
MMKTGLVPISSMTDPHLPASPIGEAGPSTTAKHRTSSSQIQGLLPFSRRSISDVSVAAGASANSRLVSQQDNPPVATKTREGREVREARKRGIQELLEGYFAPHITTGEATNREDFDRLISGRVSQLLDMGESKESIEMTFSKAAKLDIAAEAGRGFVGSLPFGVMSRILDTHPALSDTLVAGLDVLPGIKDTPDVFKGGVAAGLASGVADHIGSQALGPAMENNQWLSSSSDVLEEPMKNAKEAAQASMTRTVVENAVAIQTFSARNVLRGVVGPTMTAAHRAAAAVQTDSWLAAVGSPLAGAGFSLINRHFAAQGHRIGPAYLLGRIDWKEQYIALKAATWKGAVANGAGRVAKAGINLVNATVSAPRSLLTATSLTTNVGALGAGLGAVAMATTSAGELAKKMGVNEAGVTAAEHAGRTLSSVGVFPSWTTAAIVTDPVVSVVRGAANAVGDLVQKGVSKGVLKSAEVAGKNTRAGADFAVPKLRNARDNMIRTGYETIETVSTIVGGMTSGVSRAMDSATDALGETVSNMRRRERNAEAQSPGIDVSGTIPTNVLPGEHNV